MCIKRLFAGSNGNGGQGRLLAQQNPKCGEASDISFSLLPTNPSWPVGRFVCKNNGVLFENQLLQIGVKSEFRQNLGECFWAGPG